MNRSLQYDNEKTYLIDILSHVVFTPGFNDLTEALSISKEINSLVEHIALATIKGDVLNWLVSNNTGYGSTIPYVALTRSKTRKRNLKDLYIARIIRRI